MAGTSQPKLVGSWGALAILLALALFWFLESPLSPKQFPSAEQLAEEDFSRLFSWLKYGLFPFVLAWFVLARSQKRPFS